MRTATLIIILALCAPSIWAEGFSVGPPMLVARYEHTCTVLQNGKLLIAGGYNGLSSAEIYDPTANAWTATPAMTAGHYQHTATLLNDGRVLVVGGHTAAVELYDPVARVWTSAAPLAAACWNQTAMLLSNGKVLIAGGNVAGADTNACQIYDPVANAWTAAASMIQAREDYTSVTLPNGTILAAGGVNGNTYLNSTEIYDPVANTWTSVGSLALARAGHFSILLNTGKVLAASGDIPGLGSQVTGTSELYDPSTQTWSMGASMLTARQNASVVLLQDGRALVGGNASAAEFYNAASDTWSAAGEMAGGRQHLTAVMLPGGKALFAGGEGSAAVTTVDVYDPTFAQWQTAASLSSARNAPAAALLPSGNLLIAGGLNVSALQTAERYNPMTNTWSSAGTLVAPRKFAAAAVLSTGNVLLAGGNDGANFLSSTEMYNATTNAWSAAPSMAAPRQGHSSTKLNNGKVLVAGGLNSTGVLYSAELYDPTSNTWSAAGTLNVGRQQHTATLLSDGTVLVVGGDNGGALTSAEVYNPSTNSWSVVGALNTGRSVHTATLLPNGQVLAAGGNPTGSLTSAELYNPATKQWTLTGNLANARDSHAATLLPNGKILVTGGNTNGVTLASAELFDPSTGMWTSTQNFSMPRSLHSAILLPSGTVAIVGGNNGGTAQGSTEIFSAGTSTFTYAAAVPDPRSDHKSVLLLTGKVLVAGGYDLSSGADTSTCLLYDPVANSWSSAGSMATAREQLTLTLLSNGKVLAVGGLTNGTAVASAELYDPSANAWAPAGAMSVARNEHSATLLNNGKVLVAGGFNEGSTIYNSAELYDPVANSWSLTGSMSSTRRSHTATLLTTGRVLVVGGRNSSYLNGVESYDPTTNAWSTKSSLNDGPRAYHSASLLANGNVLVAGGTNGGTTLNTARIYNPSSNAWSAGGTLLVPRWFVSATTLPSGKVLIAGDDTNVEIYDPAYNSWTFAGAIAYPGEYPTVTKLPDGRVLIVGDASPAIEAPIYDPGLQYQSAWRPVISTANLATLPGSALTLGGQNFTGISEADGGTASGAPSNIPYVLLQSLVNDQLSILTPDPGTPWTSSAYLSGAIASFTNGPAAVTVFANGIPSVSILLRAGNSPPQASVMLSSSNPMTNDTLVATAVKSDPNGDPVTLTYTWLVNGVVKKTTAASASLTDSFDLSANGNGDKGDQIMVQVVPSDGMTLGAVASAAATVANSAPTATVQLSNTAPNTNAVLTATATKSDPDSADAVSLKFVWKVNGTVRKTTNSSSALSDTFDLSMAGNGDKGQQVSVEVTPNDGTVDGTTVIASTTVANSPPAATVQLNALTPKTNDTLTATATASDPDNDAVALTFTWKVNGNIEQTTTGSGLMDMFDLSVPGHGDKGDTVTVEVTPNDGSIDGPVVSASAVVINTPPQATVHLDNPSPTTDQTLTATAIATDADQDAVTLTFVWKVNGNIVKTTLAGNSVMDMLDLSVPGNGDKDDVISVEVTPNDGTDDGTVALDSATVQNSPPVVTVLLDNTSPQTNDMLSVTATPADPDGDALALTYVWKVNGTVKRTFQSAGDMDTFDLSIPGNGDRGDVISVEVTPNDGTVDGQPASAMATVINSAPTATVALDNLSPKTNDTLTATATESDADNDTVTWTYEWKVNGTIKRTNPGSASPMDSFDLSIPGNGDKGDTITVDVIPNDGIEDGADVTSTPAVVIDTPFVVLSGAAATPVPAGVGQSISFSVAAHDDDADPLSYQWSFGDGASASGGSPVHAYGAAGVYTASVTISNGIDAPKTSSVDVAVLAPIIGTGLDSDGDGFSDDFEIAAGTDPFNAASTPTGSSVTVGSVPMLTIDKSTIKLNFARHGKDAISFSGTLAIPDGFNPAGMKALFAVSGVSGVFTLDKKGNGVNGKESVKIGIKFTKGNVAAQVVKYTVTLNNGDFAAALENSGLIDATVTKKPVTMAISMIVNNSVLRKLQMMQYTAKAGKTGAAK